MGIKMLELRDVSYHVDDDKGKDILNHINLKIEDRFTAITGPNGGATVMARGTKLSIFDEPEAGIDLWSFQNLIQVFEQMHEQTQGSIVIISHQERILNIADRIVVIADGSITAEGSKEEILPQLLNGDAYCVHNKGGCIRG